MLRRGHGDAGAGGLQRLPPVELVHSLQLKLLQKRSVPQAGDEARVMRFLEPHERVDIEMVVVVVSDEHEVDRRQLIKREPRGAYPLGADPPQGAYPLRIHRVREDIQTPELDQERDVIDERERDLPVIEAGGRRRSGAVLDPFRPLLCLSRAPPPQKLPERAPDGCVRVEEEPAVEVIRGRAMVARPARQRAQHLAYTRRSVPWPGAKRATAS